MKYYMKKLLPNFIKKTIRQIILNKKINNYYDTSYDKYALLSYITTPFYKNSLSHTNFFEAQSWARILNEFGYNVDIIHYESNKNVDLSKYALICGFGDIFQHYFESAINKNITTIYYGTGMHVCHQNQASLQRVKDVHDKKGIWLGKSARFVEKTWTHQTSLVDGIIALGNTICAKSYEIYFDKTVFSVPAPFFQVVDARSIIESRNERMHRAFLWFGSSGLIHKGLDLLLDFFAARKDLTLHICGPIENEKDFVNAYRNELFNFQNIITHGFIDLKSQKFKEILTTCAFSIFPSCSEGGAAGIITTIGNGGLIPIISKETTVSTGCEIWIEKLTAKGIQKAVESALLLDSEQIKAMQIQNLEYVLNSHTQDIYYNRLKLAVQTILEIP